MTTQTEDTVAWACTVFNHKSMPTPSKWLWDEDYGMTSNAKDEHEVDQCDASQESAIHQQNTQAMTGMEGATPVATALQIMIKPTELEWIIDSGATHHMTPLRQALTNISSLNKAIAFSTASKTSMIAREKGEMKVKMASGRILTITDVHYVPELRVNLLSPSRMMRHGWKVNITDTGGSLSRNKERVSIQRQGDLWTIRLGKN